MSASSIINRVPLALGLTLSLYASLAAAQSSAPMSMPGMTMPASGSTAMAPMSASATSSHAVHTKQTKGGTNGTNGTASTQAFQSADATMMQRMSTPYSGDPDRDFVEHMMPHHEGAVAMARIELQYGKDPSLKRMARNIIKSQDEEIVFMKQWLKQHPAPSAQ